MSIMDSLNDTEKKLVTELVSLGLPETQAIQSAVAQTKGPNPVEGHAPACGYASFKINDGADVR